MLKISCLCEKTLPSETLHVKLRRHCQTAGKESSTHSIEKFEDSDLFVELPHHPCKQIKS